jgi:aspartate aminotransferase
LAQFYTNQGLPINVEDIIITTGGSEALLLQWVARWIWDEIIIPEPFYANYNGFSASGVNVVSVISSIDTGFALPAIADFEKLITPKQSDSYFRKPTGYLYSKKK